jgi:hypothetical protein
LLFGLLALAAGILVLSNASLGVSNAVHGQYYVLGSVMLICGLAMMLDLGSGDWWSWGRGVLGLLHFGLGVLLLVQPSFSVLDVLLIVGLIFMTGSLVAILLISELRPDPLVRSAGALAGLIPATIADRQRSEATSRPDDRPSKRTLPAARPAAAPRIELEAGRSALHIPAPVEES